MKVKFSKNLSGILTLAFPFSFHFLSSQKNRSMFIAEIHVMPLKELLDPQGKAVENGLHNLGFSVEKVRIGKRITMEINATTLAQANEIAHEACKKLLHNPVMESFEFVVKEA